MTYVPSDIEQLQLYMGAIAQNAPYLNNVPVVIARPRAALSATMIQDKIDKSLLGLVTQNGGTGAAVVIYMPKGDSPDNEAPGPDLRLTCAIDVVENPLINMGASGTMKSAEDIMLVILNLFHQRFFQNWNATLMVDRDAYSQIPEYLAKNWVAYQTRFVMRMVLGGPVKTPMPGITGDSTAGVMISGAPGATVCFTLDGSYPSPTNTAAQVLLDSQGNAILDSLGNEILTGDGSAIAVTPGQLVLAVAYQDNQQASDLAALTVS